MCKTEFHPELVPLLVATRAEEVTRILKNDTIEELVANIVVLKTLINTSFVPLQMKPVVDALVKSILDEVDTKL